MLSSRTATTPLKAAFINTRRYLSSTTPKRSSSASSDAAAATAAAAFLARFQSQGPQTRTQLLDANQLHLLSLTLNRPQRRPIYPGEATTAAVTSPSPLPYPSNGTPIPPGYHLVYFTPAFLENELGADGTDASYNPDAPFTRRMWAGGQVSWPRATNGKQNLLRIGQEVTETTKVLSAEAKVVRKTGEAMIVVGVEKTFANEEGVAVVDRRNWVFRETLPYPPLQVNQTKKEDKIASSQPTTTTTQESQEPEEGVYKRAFKQSPVTLFRFSALTFNPHKIHYSVPWAQDVEGHRGIVVHGPLNLLLMLDFWRDIQHKKNKIQGHADTESALVMPQSISYRATNTLYAEEDYEIVLREEGASSSVNIYDHAGVVSMKAEIQA